MNIAPSLSGSATLNAGMHLTIVAPQAPTYTLSSIHLATPHFTIPRTRIAL